MVRWAGGTVFFALSSVTNSLVEAKEGDGYDYSWEVEVDLGDVASRNCRKIL